MVKAVEKCLHDAQLYASISQKGVAYAKDFSRQQAAEKHDKLYRSIVKPNIVKPNIVKPNIVKH